MITPVGLLLGSGTLPVLPVPFLLAPATGVLVAAASAATLAVVFAVLWRRVSRPIGRDSRRRDLLRAVPMRS